MRVLLLIIGVASLIAGRFIGKESDVMRSWRIMSGVSLILSYLALLRSDIKLDVISFFFIVIIVIILIGAISKTEISGKLTVRQNNIARWGMWSMLLIYLCIILKIPSVTLDNGIIHMGGMSGSKFNVADIQSVDTVNIEPQRGTRHGGASFPGGAYGNFKVRNERDIVKFCIWIDKPPYIRIRMDDNRLFVFNFRKPDKTIEFYDQIQNALMPYKENMYEFDIQ